MKVLVACEFSQVVCMAFRKRGHNAYSCDIIPCEGEHPEWHIHDDVRNHLNDGWDMMIAHDPCTYQCLSGVRWLGTIPGRWSLLTESCAFTKELLSAKIPMICRENPIPHHYAVELIGMDYTQKVQPHYFIGSNESKATCFWLIGLPELNRTQWLEKSEIKQSIWRMPPSETRGHERSRFPVSIAKSMAEQWG